MARDRVASSGASDPDLNLVVLAVRRNELRDFSGSKGPALDVVEATEGSEFRSVDGGLQVGADDDVPMASRTDPGAISTFGS
jgi:hypothetical protein